MHAAIVAGGLGTRAAAMTADRIPKALLPVGGLPIIFRQLRVLRREGVTRVSVLAGHLGDLLRPVLEPEAVKLGMALRIIVESQPLGTHCSRLSRNGSHISTHTASIPFRWRLVNSVRKYSSSVSFLRSFPNHNGSAVSRLHTTVRNLSRFPWYSSSTPMCRNGGFRRLASQRSKYRRSMPRTVLCARPIRRATCRAAALSQDCPTASSNRLL